MAYNSLFGMKSKFKFGYAGADFSADLMIFAGTIALIYVYVSSDTKREID